MKRDLKIYQSWVTVLNMLPLIMDLSLIHILETLEYLKNRGYPLGIVTTKLKVAADVGLNTFDLKKYFDVVIGLDDVKVTKPDPEGIIKAMEDVYKRQVYDMFTLLSSN